MNRLFVLFILVLFSINLGNADSLKLTKEESKILKEIHKYDISDIEKDCITNIKKNNKLKVDESDPVASLLLAEESDPCYLSGSKVTNPKYSNFYYSVSCKLGNTKSCDIYSVLVKANSKNNLEPREEKPKTSKEIICHLSYEKVSHEDFLKMSDEEYSRRCIDNAKTDLGVLTIINHLPFDTYLKTPIKRSNHRLSTDFKESKEEHQFGVLTRYLNNFNSHMNR